MTGRGGNRCTPRGTSKVFLAPLWRQGLTNCWRLRSFLTSKWSEIMLSIFNCFSCVPDTPPAPLNWGRPALVHSTPAQRSTSAAAQTDSKAKKKGGEYTGGWKTRGSASPGRALLPNFEPLGTDRRPGGRMRTLFGSQLLFFRFGIGHRGGQNPWGIFTRNRAA